MQSLASKSQNNQSNNAFYRNINPYIGYQKIRMMLKFKYCKRWQVKTKYTDWLIKKTRNASAYKVKEVPQNNHPVWELHIRRESREKSHCDKRTTFKRHTIRR